MARSKVAVLLTRPSTVLEDYRRLIALSEVDHHLDPGTAVPRKSSRSAVRSSGIYISSFSYLTVDCRVR